MTITKQSIMTGVIGLLIGLAVAGVGAGQAVNNNNTNMMRMMGVDTSKVRQVSATDHSTMSMADMTSQLQDKSGDDFDKAFLEMMIAHHQGAIDMAELIPSRAKHAEVKKLGNEVISAQTREITDMMQWQKDWGYSSDEMMNMMHGSH